MAHSGYGGIRASASARIGAHVGPSARGRETMQTSAVAPMSTAPPRVSQGRGPEVYQALVVLVLIEAAFLVAMRNAFKHYHGG